MDSHATGDAFLFFQPGLKLRAAAPPSTELTAPQVLAGRLLTAASPSDSAHWRDAEQQLGRLRERLQQVEAAEQRGRLAAARELWTLLAAEVQTVADTPLIGEWLFEHARLLGQIDQAEALTAQVLDALTEELLPLLHLKWYLPERPRRHRFLPQPFGHHESALARWQPAAGCPVEVVPLYALYLAMLARRCGVVPRQLGRNVQTLLARPGLPVLTADFLAESYARVVKLHLGHSLSQAIPEHVLSERIAEFAVTIGYPLPALVAEQGDSQPTGSLVPVHDGEITYSAPPLLPALQVLSLLHQARGRQRIRQPGMIAEGVIDVCLACLYDPNNDLASDDRATLRTFGTGLEQIAAALSTGLAAADCYTRGPANDWFGAYFQDAVVREITLRLGLDVTQRDRTSALMAALDRAMKQPTDLPLWAKGREYIMGTVVAAHPELADLDWGLLNQAIGYSLSRSVQLVDRIDEAAAVAPYLRQLGFVEPSPPATPSRVPWMLGRATLWLTSGADRAYKAAAVGGLVLLLISGLTSVYDGTRVSRHEQRYLQVVQGLEQGVDERIIPAAAAFLGASVGRSDDPRVDQVRGVLSDALDRESQRLEAQGKPQDGALLRRRYAGLTQPPGDAEGTAAP